MSPLLKNSCRICLLYEGNISIFDTENNGENIVDLINKITNLNMVSDDGFLTKICAKCKDNIDAIFEFKKKCIFSDRIMRKHYLPKNVTVNKNVAESAHIIVKDEPIQSLNTYSESESSENNFEQPNNFESDHGNDDSENEESNKFESDHASNGSDTEEEKQKGTPQTFVCDKCFKVCSSNTNLIEHKKVHNTKHYECIVCKKTFRAERSLRSHLNELHKNLKCKDCYTFCKDDNSLDIHTKTHTDKIHKCEICLKSYKNIKSLTSHNSNVHLNRSLVCEFCGKEFKTLKYFKRHVKLHEDGYKFKCDHCSKSFLIQRDLSSHLKSHNSEVDNTCNICHKTYNLQSTLAQHIKLIHRRELKHECYICKKKLLSASHLKIHIRAHNGERPFKCHICPQGFHQECGLTNHLRKHSGLRQFKCDMCDKDFIFPNNLVTHKKVHFRHLNK